MCDGDGTTSAGNGGASMSIEPTAAVAMPASAAQQHRARRPASVRRRLSSEARVLEKESSLSPAHAALIAASGISDEVARARGYRTVTRQVTLRALGFSGNQARRVPGLLTPIWDVRGAIATYQTRPDTPRIDGRRGRAVKYETVAGDRLVVDVPPAARERIGDPSIPLWISEGVRKADSAVTRGLCCVALLGVWNWRGSNEHGGKTALADWEAIALKDRRVVIAFDSDVFEKPEVRAALVRLSNFLRSRGADVWIARLSALAGGKVGLDDYFAAGGTVEELEAGATRDLPCDSAPLTSADSRPAVIFDSAATIQEIGEKAWTGLEKANTPPALFRHAGTLARVETDDDGAPVIRDLDLYRLRHELGRRIRWIEERETQEGTKSVDVDPPLDLVRDLLATPGAPLPVLVRLVEAPLFAADGTLHDVPGYLASTRCIFVPGALVVPTVPIEPTDLVLAEARRLLSEELLGDFPFVSDADRAHTIALLILAFVRELIQGPTPLHLIDKPSPGTGATLLVEAIACIVIGRGLASVTEGQDEDEWRKRLFSYLRLGPSLVLIDNVSRRLGSAALASLLTAWPTWQDRVLGESEMREVAVRCAWVVTGNNVGLSHEMARRSVRIRLDAHVDRPWLRNGFRHADLLGWVRENRGRLVWSALVLVRRWLAAGQPEPQCLRLGMYEPWTRVIGGILAAAGIPGFLGNLDHLYDDADEEGNAWRGFLSAWWEKFSGREVKSADLFEIASEMDGLRLGDGSEQSRRVKLGVAIRHQRDRVYGLDDVTIRIEQAGTKKRAGLWQLRVVGTKEPGESGESGESVSVPRDVLGPISTRDARARDDVGGAGAKGAEETHHTHQTHLPAEAEQTTWTF